MSMVYGEMPWLDKMRSAADVQRMHTLRTHRRQSLGQHSFNVCTLVLHLTAGGASRSLLLAAMFHDLHEVDTGDVPAPAKRKTALGTMHDEAAKLFNEKHRLNQTLYTYEQAILKVADSLEFALFATEEIEAGNGHLIKPCLRAVGYATEVLMGGAFKDRKDVAVRAFAIIDHCHNVRRKTSCR